jgi:hypothetical protein
MRLEMVSKYFSFFCTIFIFSYAYSMNLFSDDSEYQSLEEDAVAVDVQPTVIVVNGPLCAFKSNFVKKLKIHLTAIHDRLKVEIISKKDAIAKDQSKVDGGGIPLAYAFQQEDLAILTRIRNSTSSVIICDVALWGGQMLKAFCQSLEEMGFNVKKVLMYCPIGCFITEDERQQDAFFDDERKSEKGDTSIMRHIRDFFCLYPSQKPKDKKSVSICVLVRSDFLLSIYGDTRLSPEVSDYFATFMPEEKTRLYAVDYDLVFQNKHSAEFDEEVRQVAKQLNKMI